MTSIRQRQRQSVYFRHQTDEWATPLAPFAELDREFHFNTDVAAIRDNAKCDHFSTPAEDGLAQPWQGFCWMNPRCGPPLRQWMK